MNYLETIGAMIGYQTFCAELPKFEMDIRINNSELRDLPAGHVIIGEGQMAYCENVNRCLACGV